MCASLSTRRAHALRLWHFTRVRCIARWRCDAHHVFIMSSVFEEGVGFPAIVAVTRIDVGFEVSHDVASVAARGQSACLFMF